MPSAQPCCRALLIERLNGLSTELAELDLGVTVDRIDAAELTPELFLRGYVAANKPLLISRALDHTRAMARWSRAHLEAAAGDAPVSVDTTPNGLGDAVTPLPGGAGRCFCTPFKRRMSLRQFLALFFEGPGAARAAQQQQEQQHEQQQREGQDGRSGLQLQPPLLGCEVPYLQQQNSNLTEELPQLAADLDAQLGFAAAAFGEPPAATNLWIGDERSTTTFHKDHYENLYAVIRGSKVFHLLPPSSVYRLSLACYPAAQFQPAGGELQPVLQPDQPAVMWCPIHPEPADPAAAAAEHPLFFDPALPPPLRVEVGPGDTLYLPALWHHYVQQRADPEQGWCVAVNWWYEMRFSTAFAHFKLVEALAQDAGLVPRL